MTISKKGTDPVCGMAVDVMDSTLRSNYRGKEYYFCSSNCLEKLEKNPNEYIKDVTSSDDKDIQSHERDHHHVGHDHLGGSKHHH